MLARFNAPVRFHFHLLANVAGTCQTLRVASLSVTPNSFQNPSENPNSTQNRETLTNENKSHKLLQEAIPKIKQYF